MTPEEQKIADDQAATAAAEEAAKAEEARKAAEAGANPQDPSKPKPKTEAEKAAYTLKKNAERVTQLGGDPLAVLGIQGGESFDDADDNSPVTVGMLRQRDAEKAKLSALQMADAITDDVEREAVKGHLNDTIRPSGNPTTDLANARALANQDKNRLLLEEQERKKSAVGSPSGSGGPAKPEETIVLSAEERMFTQAPFNMTPAEIVAARPKA